MTSPFDASELCLLVKRPSELDEMELGAFEQMVVKGGEIDPDDLRFRLLNADHLAYFVDNDLIVATGAIKNPTLRHKTDIARKTKIDLSSYQKELGYISVEPSYQRHQFSLKNHRKSSYSHRRANLCNQPS